MDPGSGRIQNCPAAGRIRNDSFAFGSSFEEGPNLLDKVICKKCWKFEILSGSQCLDLWYFLYLVLHLSWYIKIRIRKTWKVGSGSAINHYGFKFHNTDVHSAYNFLPSLRPDWPEGRKLALSPEWWCLYPTLYRVSEQPYHGLTWGPKTCSISWMVVSVSSTVSCIRAALPWTDLRAENLLYLLNGFPI